MAQRVGVLVVRPGDLGSLPGPPTVKGENQFLLKVVL